MRLVKGARRAIFRVKRKQAHIEETAAERAERVMTRRQQQPSS